MCSPISVATGGATGGCTGICRFMPQIIASLSVFGVLVELFYGKWDCVGGGLGNLSCLGITWIAFGFHQQIWAEATQALLPFLAAFISGVAGVLLARVVVRLIAGKIMKRLHKT